MSNSPFLLTRPFLIKVRREVLVYFIPVTCILLALWSYYGSFDESDSKGQVVLAKSQDASTSFFNLFDYYLTKDGKPYLQIRADFLTAKSDTSDLFFVRPRGLVYNDKGDFFNYAGEKGQLVENKSRLLLEQEVEVYDDRSLLQADAINYFLKEERVVADKNVKSFVKTEEAKDQIEVFAQKLVGFPQKETAHYTGDVRGKIKRKRAYEEEFDFRSDKLDLMVQEHRATLLGNVHVTKQNLKAWGRRGELYLENYNKKLKYYTLHDDVKLLQKVKKDGVLQERMATGELLEGFMSESLVILTGNPKVYQNQDTVRGNQIILREESDIIEVDQAISNFKLQ